MDANTQTVHTRRACAGVTHINITTQTHTYAHVQVNRLHMSCVESGHHLIFTIDILYDLAEARLPSIESVRWQTWLLVRGLAGFD